LNGGSEFTHAFNESNRRKSDKQILKLKQITDYPWDGNVRIEVAAGYVCGDINWGGILNAIFETVEALRKDYRKG